MRVFSLLVFGMALAGCSRSADINFVNGQPFLIGDDGCARYRSVTETVIQCYTSDGRPNGARGALTPQQMQFIMLRRQQQTLEAAAFSAQMQAASQNFNAGAQANLRASSNFQAPQIQSFAPQQNTIVNCWQTGPITHCR